MDPIQNALRDVHFAIPRRILDTAFILYGQGVNNYQVNIDSVIRDQVIISRVMKDCNLVGGTEINVDIIDCEVLEQDDYKAVIRIPKSKTNGRLVVSVTSLTERQTDIGSNMDTFQSTMSLQANPLPNLDFQYTSQIRIMGDNLVFVENIQPQVFDMAFKCLVENDKNFTNLPAQAYPQFSKLVELAVKAYIYNKLLIEMDEGYVQGGANIGALKNIVESYADANQMYNEYLEQTWTKVAFMTDQSRYGNFLNAAIQHN